MFFWWSCVSDIKMLILEINKMVHNFLCTDNMQYHSFDFQLQTRALVDPSSFTVSMLW